MLTDTFVPVASCTFPVVPTTLPRAAESIEASSMERYAPLHAQMLEQGIYLAPSGYEVGFLSTAHNEADLDRLVEALGNSLKGLYEA